MFRGFGFDFGFGVYSGVAGFSVLFAAGLKS